MAVLNFLKELGITQSIVIVAFLIVFFRGSLNGLAKRLDGSISRLESKTDSQFKELRAETDSQFKELRAETDVRFNAIDTALNNHNATEHKEIRSQLEDLQKTVSGLGAQMSIIIELLKAKL